MNHRSEGGVLAPTRRPLFAIAAITLSLPLCAAFIVLSGSLGLQAHFIGFLFIAYWGGVEGASTETFARTLCGFFFGLALGLCLKILSIRFGEAGGGGAFVLVIVPVVYSLLTSRFTLFVNPATMLMLTVATISQVQHGASFFDLFASLALGAAYFGTILLSLQALAARRMRMNRP